MTTRGGKVVKHRTVIDRDTATELSRTPAMRELLTIFEGMTEEERARTLDYLSEHEAAGEGVLEQNVFDPILSSDFSEPKEGED